MMPAPRIRTVTLNPTIDLSSDVEELRPTDKLRTRNERMDPGGGGINVARVLRRFGADVEALYLAGGVTGALLDELLVREHIRRQRIEIAQSTRLSHTVHDCATGKEYRFVPEGPCVSADELAEVFEAAEEPCDYLVASGSLPPCTDADLYARLAERLVGSNSRLVLDTSGAELAAALQIGGFFLVKPSRSELEALVGEPLPDIPALAAAAAAIVSRGAAEHVAVTLGREGAMLATGNGVFTLPAVAVDTRSAVGAGDSFLAAMVFAVAGGKPTVEAFQLGAAAGAAAALTPGTGLCRVEDVMRLLSQVEEPTRLA